MYIEIHRSLTTDNMFGVKSCPHDWFYRRQITTADWLAVSI